MPGHLKTTYPTWHQEWACIGCERHADVIVRVQSMSQQWLRQMTRDVDASHRAVSPLCPHDISTKWKVSHPQLATALRYGYHGPMVLRRPYRQSKNTGQRIWAQGPNETEADVACRVKKEVWPPWMGSN